jgi:hypothetical protein
VALDEELHRVAEAALDYVSLSEEITAVIPTEPRAGSRVYLCAFGKDEGRTWLALDPEGRPLNDRVLVRDAVSIAALCELAEETAGGGRLDELRAQLVALRETERPEGIEEAEEAALELERTLGSPPRVATPAYLDRVSEATRRLEAALGEGPGSPFGAAMTAAVTIVDELLRDVEASYRGELS